MVVLTLLNCAILNDTHKKDDTKYKMKTEGISVLQRAFYVQNGKPNHFDVQNNYSGNFINF